MKIMCNNFRKTSNFHLKTSEYAFVASSSVPLCRQQTNHQNRPQNESTNLLSLGNAPV